MKSILILISLCFSLQAFGVPRATFPIGGQQVLIVIAGGQYEGPDTDAAELYRRMNVPPQDSFIGPGKSIVTEDKNFNFVCSIRQGQGTQCSIVLKRSENVQINPAKKYARYYVQGAQAKTLSEKFTLNQDGQWLFETVDGKFKMAINSDNFLLEFLD
ncbi:MAG: hypothetical protein BroJett040_24810 [Oligoflexia bacterium]|nr:MAG: hypothetical protein BroJett040_24810 [Oligoflexia bacterium]